MTIRIIFPVSSSGVPKFANQDKHSVVDLCPTCIQAKQTKTAAGPNSTKAATCPCQGLSIDFCSLARLSKIQNGFLVSLVSLVRPLGSSFLTILLA